MIRLGLMRHGHTAWNRAGQIQGRTDEPLDAEARDQLSRLRLPDGWHEADVVASPLSRATETARLVTGRVPHTDPALIEMDWGAWEGAKGVELRRDPASGFKDIEDWGWDYRPPQGETPAELRARLVPWVAGLQRDTVAVCHIGVMRVILACATKWNFDRPAPFTVKRNRLFVLHISADQWMLTGTERLVEETA